MPLYFFHTRNGGDYDDDDGTRLADDTAARAEAIRTAGAVLKDLGWGFQDWAGLVDARRERDRPNCLRVAVYRKTASFTPLK